MTNERSEVIDEDLELSDEEPQMWTCLECEARIFVWGGLRAEPPPHFKPKDNVTYFGFVCSACIQDDDFTPVAA